MMRSLTLALIEQDRIKTTPARAKEVRRLAEKVVTLGKRGDLAARRRVVRLLGSTRTNKPGSNRVRLAIQKLFSDIAPRFKTRNGGYTRHIKIGRRPGDNAEMCLMEFVTQASKAKKAAPKGDKKAEKKVQAKSDKSASAPKAKPAKSAAPSDKGSIKKSDLKSKKGPSDKPLRQSKRGS
ncbi:MAG: 50S ribosomal protein L17 [Bdellovibrionales bacterium]|nr:50S ribosomal protein L17 [Bdellovibrionales bacterium]